MASKKSFFLKRTFQPIKSQGKGKGDFERVPSKKSPIIISLMKNMASTKQETVSTTIRALEQNISRTNTFVLNCFFSLSSVRPQIHKKNYKILLLGAFLRIELCILVRSFAFCSLLSAVLPKITSSHSLRVARNLTLIQSKLFPNESYLLSETITRIGSRAGKTETSKQHI